MSYREHLIDELTASYREYFGDDSYGVDFHAMTTDQLHRERRALALDIEAEAS